METTTTTCGGDLDLPFLSEDILIRKILVCLPVKSLLRFKSVCKSWRQRIESSFFIDLHTTTTSSKFGAFIIQTTEPSRENYEDDVKLFMLTSESGSGDGTGTGTGGEDEDDDDNDDQKKKKKRMVFKVNEDLGFLPIYKDYLLHDTLRMVGSCNGIICLHDPKVLDISVGISRHHYKNLRDVCLWNPATRQFRILPKSIPIEEKQDYIGNWLEDFIALGFDVKTKDYKVLRITPLWERSEKGRGCMWERSEEGRGFMCRAQVYSLSTDSWRLLEGIHSLPVLPSQGMSSSNSGIYLNGSYFFANCVESYTESSRVCMLLSFDFTKEIFTTSIQLPSYINSSKVSSYYLGGEKLAIFTKPPRYQYLGVDDGYEYYNIWVLNEQQHDNAVVNTESWTKLHSFRIESSHTEPRCISNNGEFALISTGSTDDVYPRNKLQLFDLITKEAKKDFLIGTLMCRADVYKESLVSIMGGGGGNVLLRWQLPTHGTTYKLNLDAPFIKDCGCTLGIGLCLTSDTGGCIGVRSLKRYVDDAEEGEAMAMLEAIKWAKELKLSPIIIESNSKNCISFFMDDDDDDDDNDNLTQEALSLLREAKLLLNSSEIGSSISVQYCARSCNYVADIAAKLGREGCTWSCKDWSSANFPGEMVRSLSKDLGSVTR